MARAVQLIEAVCCTSGSPTFIDDIQRDRSPKSLHRTVVARNTPALFDWMMDSFSYQGVSNQVAATYLEEHGNATWPQISSAIAHGAPCPRLASFWTYESCRYEKQSGSCTHPEHASNCSVPRHGLRNGRLNQTAYSLYLFIRDIANGDLAKWIDSRLSLVPPGGDGRGQKLQDTLVAPMRHIFGVSDKVLTMTLSELLMAAPASRPHWFEAGSQMIAVDTLVHNFLHRTGILSDFGVAHAYGRACYQTDRCADILRGVSAQIDARRFNVSFPAVFPRFVQHAVWHYCAAEGDNVCNGNNIDDAKSCEQIYCILNAVCSKNSLKS